VRLLLDTHAFLWFLMGDPRLSTRAREVMETESNERLLSIASAWVIAIKTSLGKLKLSAPLAVSLHEQMAANDVTLLPVSLAHVNLVARLPFHHRDPCDRLLVAQSIEEKIPLVSADDVVAKYGVERIW